MKISKKYHLGYNTGESDNMIKRIFLTLIALQTLFIGQCYASSDRLTDIGVEILKKRIEEKLPYVITTDISIRNEAEIARVFPPMAGTHQYEFFVALNPDVLVSIDVYVNREGYTDAIQICGTAINETRRKFLALVVEESMKSIGLNEDEIMWLVSREGTKTKKIFEENVYAVEMGKTVYYQFINLPDGFSCHTIDKMSIKDRLTR